MTERRESRFERGLVLLESGHYEEARDYLEASLNKEGYCEECYMAYTDACFFLNGDADDRDENGDDQQEGEDNLQAGLIAVQEGMKYLEKGQFGRAIQRLREAVVTVPETATEPLIVALTHKAEQYMEGRFYKKSIALYDECVSLGDRNSTTMYLRAWAHLHAGNAQQAQKDVERALELLAKEDRHLTTAVEHRRHPGNNGDEAGATAAGEKGETPLSEMELERSPLSIIDSL